jgi:5-methylcytosine-specific restriction endonuclease McrA
MLRRTPLRTHTPLRQESPKRVEQRALLAHVQRQALIRDGYTCQGMAIPDHRCAGRNDLHHLQPVGRGGPRLELANLKTLCRAAHDWVHEHPREATELGLLRSGYGDVVTHAGGASAP